WLYRAYKAGLRLMVVHAVNAEAICGLAVGRKAPGRTCDDMEAVDLQLAEARPPEANVDPTAGGTGKGEYRIVTAATEERHVIESGKLAVVLGIEVDNLFGCRLGGACTEDSVRRSLQRYYDRGVRHIIPIHLANNAFGGFALFSE